MNLKKRGFYEIFFHFFDDLYEIESRKKEWKTKILDEWENSKKLPRKKKKKKRKELLLNWSIANYNPFKMSF